MLTRQKRTTFAIHLRERKAVQTDQRGRLSAVIVQADKNAPAVAARLRKLEWRTRLDSNLAHLRIMARQMD